MKKVYEYQWVNIKRILKYLKGTRIMERNIMVDLVSIVKWCTCDLYQIHKGFKGHTGDMLSLVKGYLICMSRKHSFNTRSLSECEFLG